MAQAHRKMQNHKKAIMLPVICLAAFLCAGCADLPDWSESGGVRGFQYSTMESTPIVDYSVPRFFPNIFVDLTGYRSEGVKRAVIKGKRLPKTFDLVDADTKKTVYTGNLEEVEYNAEQQIYSAYADFQKWNQEGRYYIECEYIGRSYIFSLEKGFYDTFFDEMCQDIIAECKAQTVTVSDINRILQAYEWYGEVFPDNDGDGIPDMLEAVADWIEDTGEQPVPEGQEAAYAAALAKFSYLYQNYNRNYATDCVKRASVVFAQSQNVVADDAEYFHALTELYRATGLNTYKNMIDGYKNYFESHMGLSEEEGYLYGAMTYINTRQKVNVSLCEIFVDSLMERGEVIRGLYPEMIHPVTEHNNGDEDVLRHVSELACANYVINNPEYSHIMEEFLHYLRGRNAQSVDFYVSGTEARTKYLIMLTQIVAIQDNL